MRFTVDVQVIRREAAYLREAHGTGHAHRRARWKSGVRWHLAGPDGACLEVCRQPGWASCGYTRRREAQLAVAHLRAKAARAAGSAAARARRGRS